MKRKSFYLIALALCLTLALTACSVSVKTPGSRGDSTGSSPASTQGNNSGSANTPASSNNGTGGNTNAAANTPSIVPATGWVTDPNVPAAICVSAYKSDAVPNTNIVLSTSILSDPSDDYVKAQQSSFKVQYADSTFSDITKTTVNGMDAQEFTISDDSNYLRLVYFCIDKQVYIIQCKTDKNSLDSVKGDFQSMIDSFTLK